jgi:putative flavoprotein involved in K+ transport
MSAVDTVVVGAGHAGLAVSRLLTDAGRDHVVLDRGRVGEHWRTARWDSLHLLTPSWMSRLPGWWYGGPDPEGYMSAGRFVRHLVRYAESFDAPVLPGTTVVDLSRSGDGYRVVTNRSTWHARHVVVATGPHGRPNVPPALEHLDRVGDARVLTSNRYRNPRQLAPGGVLVVGASSSGAQIADELARAGRRVVLAVGGHTRMPRRYRGMDVFWWMETTGRLARTIDEMPDPAAARRETSLQLVGRNGPESYGRDLDLATLQARGVRLVGRVEGVDGHTVHLGHDLAGTVAAADRKMHRFLDTVDGYVHRSGLTHEVLPAVRPRPVDVPPTPERLDLPAERIGTVLLATGFRPDFPWLRLPVLEPDGSIRQNRGVTPAPGLYVVGQRFQHRRDSGLIDGARHDARAVVAHLLGSSERASAGRQGLEGEEPAA